MLSQPVIAVGSSES